MSTKNKEELYQIGDVANKSHSTIRTIRYYEEIGLISPCKRSKGGFRLYDKFAVQRAIFIHQLRLLGFPLKKISHLIFLRNRKKTGGETSLVVLDELEKFLKEVKEHLRQYNELEREIKATIKFVNECRNCSLETNRVNCSQCDVVIHKKKIPLPLKAIL